MRKFILLILGFYFLVPLSAQLGGESVYSFLEITNSARVTALGGENVSLTDGDLNLAYHNPALLSPVMDQHLTLSYINFYSDINYGYAAYAVEKPGIGTFAAGIHYVNYGLFERRDIYGGFEGYFRASEYAINLLYSRSIIDSVLTVGVNLKPILSVLESYTSLGLTADLGAVYRFKSTNTTVGLAMKNMGAQLISYAGTREKVPFEIQAGLTQPLAHAPIRFHFVLQHLEQWDLTYESNLTTTSVVNAETQLESTFSDISDKMLRHAIFGAEFLIGKNFYFDLGYNYKVRQEMKLNDYPGMVGFSWGFGLLTDRFQLSYGRSRLHIGNVSHHFTFSMALDAI